MVDLQNKVAIITGASSGIGAATALEFANAGCRLVLAARRRELLDTVAQKIRTSGAAALTVPTDVGRLDDIHRLIELTLERFGRIDVLFNNAGFGRLDWLEKQDPLDDIEAQLRVNVLGVMLLTRQALPTLIAQHGGHIINMASVAGLMAMPTHSVYAATKFAVVGFSEALRRELAPQGINVSVVCPGIVTETEFEKHARPIHFSQALTPSFLKITVERLARLVVDLARRPRPCVIVPGVYRPLIWLNRLLPGPVDWVVATQFATRRSRENQSPPG